MAIRREGIPFGRSVVPPGPMCPSDAGILGGLVLGVRRLLTATEGTTPCLSPFCAESLAVQGMA
jgi:hypothetical protein